MTIYTRPRFNSPDSMLLPFGGEDPTGGYNDESSVLVNVTADGVDLNSIWAEIQSALDVWNSERGAITNLLSYWTTNTADAIPQAMSDESFELASEFGEPTALRAPNEYLLLGYTFADYDKATRFTWKFLRDSTAEQIRAVANYAMAADAKLVQGTILERLFSPDPGQNEWGHTCFGLYNGDNFAPPPYLGRTFDAPHAHYLVSDGTDLDSGDLEALAGHVSHHGYNGDSGAQLLAFVNPAQAEVISGWRAGIENANDQVAKHDFIPSQSAPPYILANGATIVGSTAPAEFNGLKVQGSYGELWVIQSDFIPEGYLAAVASYGPNSQSNAIGVRQHVNPSYQGLRQIPGYRPGYPLQDSFFARGFGVGVRHRGAAAVMQIKASGDYEPPSIAK